MLFTLPPLLLLKKKKKSSKSGENKSRGEVGKVLKGGQKVSGCSDRMGRLRQLGEQRAGKVDEGEKGETGEVDGRRKGGEEKEERGGML